MEDKGFKQIYYILHSQQAWLPGKCLLNGFVQPGWSNSSACTANVAILKMIRS